MQRYPVFRESRVSGSFFDTFLKGENNETPNFYDRRHTCHSGISGGWSHSGRGSAPDWNRQGRRCVLYHNRRYGHDYIFVPGNRLHGQSSDLPGR